MCQSLTIQEIPGRNTNTTIEIIVKDDRDRVILNELEVKVISKFEIQANANHEESPLPALCLLLRVTSTG